MSLSRASFDFIRTALRQRSASQLDDDKSYLVETRLLAVARRHGFESVEALVLCLRSRENESLMGEIVEAMVITETCFFRDGYPFEVLRQTVLPDLIQRRASIRGLTVWSAACASGQEVYSMAILLRQHFPDLAGWNIRLIASDLSVTMLARARQGRYSKSEVSRGLSPELLKAYFREEENGWQIRDDIRRMVDFRCLNLSGLWPELPPLDLVLLRNVLIYFDMPTRQQVLARVRKVIQPDGYLLLGGAETTLNLNDDFEPVSFGQVSFYRPRSNQAK
jgi:chemotaxis protein methyltransferase CheR